MLEYFTYKKVKKSRNEKAERERLEREAREAKSPTSPLKSPTSPIIVSKPPAEDPPLGDPLLDQEDERFLERMVSPDAKYDDDDDVESRPPLPPRIPTPVMTWDSDSESFTTPAGKGKGKEIDTLDTAPKPGNKRFSVITNIGRSISMRRKPTEKSGLQPPHLQDPAREVVREVTDINKVLDDLNLSAQNNKVFSLSAESTEMVRKFNLVLKDIVNGAPTAYQDLVNLIEDRDGILAKNYEKLPKSLQKLVTQLPTKLSSTLAPELLAVAAEAQGLNKADAAAQGGLKGAAKSFLTPKSLQDLVTKPGAVAGLLKSIVNVLKTRWPAFMGTNVLWSISLFLLLSVLWYCHKRGREVRLEKEAAEQDDPLHGVDRVEELPDDPQLLPGPSNVSSSSQPTRQKSGRSSPASHELKKKNKK
ncbi:hypothetical protein PFICI_05128 [Pestalotiopsis fici W106-1]|uniref:Ring-like domain-containing protein n=1 Tax=Pestalotiopsis fici (strain W106-1 / CGMCC3.15140) TaxID=1229662 RepID=W3XCW9_PESFW|nr:uncharacterized protein PFICI_05128 [Pestalotiopsis fici W106-1]ETS83252.1 hypothetical protein PFICI_05128 [Pestalotiopsis fici W106-1]